MFLKTLILHKFPLALFFCLHFMKNNCLIEGLIGVSGASDSIKQCYSKVRLLLISSSVEKFGAWLILVFLKRCISELPVVDKCRLKLQIVDCVLRYPSNSVDSFVKLMIIFIFFILGEYPVIVVLVLFLLTIILLFNVITYFDIEF